MPKYKKLAVRSPESQEKIDNLFDEISTNTQIMVIDSRCSVSCSHFRRHQSKDFHRGRNEGRCALSGENVIVGFTYCRERY